MRKDKIDQPGNDVSQTAYSFKEEKVLREESDAQQYVGGMGPGDMCGYPDHGKKDYKRKGE